MSKWSGLSAVLAASVLGVAGLLSACESSSDAPESRTVVLDEQGAPAGLDHYRRWSDRVGQGAQPEGEVAFRNLSALGYRTILSVDGARPDAETAARFGLRYVHVPIEYSGLNRDQQLRIVQAVRTADGPVYVHCHHGLHRGPAGAAIARMTVDGVTPAQANEDLKASGCAPKYAGLYRDVVGFVPPTEEELSTVPKDLPSFQSLGDLVDRMAACSRCFERVQACEKAGWQPPENQPDVSPRHESTILLEHFREMQRLSEAHEYGDEFLGWLAASEADCAKLEQALGAGRPEEATKALSAVKKTCDTCHSKHRDH